MISPSKTRGLRTSAISLTPPDARAAVSVIAQEVRAHVLTSDPKR